MRGRNLMQAGDDEGAIAAYCIAKGLLNSGNNNDVSTDPRLPLARLYTKCGRYSEAETEYQGLMSYGGTPIKYEYGQFLMNQGRFASAMSIWSDLISQNPKDPIPVYGMALALEATDSPDSAKDYYHRCVDMAPNSEQAANAKMKLARLDSAIEKRDSGTFFPVDPEYGEGVLGWWSLEKMPLHVYIDDGTNVRGYRPEMKNFIYRALEEWRQASKGHITFVLDPPDPKGEAAWREAFGKTDPLLKMESTKMQAPEDPVITNIHVHWTESLGGLALGLAWTSAYGSKMKGKKHALNSTAHIWINTNSLADGSAIPKITAANTAILEKQNRVISEVSVHEFGHVLGLPHSSNSKDVMCSGIFSLNTSDLLESRALSVGDIRSLAEHYNNFEGRGYPASAILVDDDEKADDKPSELKPPAASGGGKGSFKVTALPSTDSSSSEAKKNPSPNNKGAGSPYSIHIPSPQELAKKRLEKDLNDANFEIETKNYAEAITKLDSILLQQPANPSAHYMKAVAYVYLKNYKEAQKEYALVIKAAPGSALAQRASEGLAKLKNN